MLHAKAVGESFGLAVAEFAFVGVPVLTFLGSPELAHLDLLTDGLLIGYTGFEDVFDELTVLERREAPGPVQCGGGLQLRASDGALRRGVPPFVIRTRMNRAVASVVASALTRVPSLEQFVSARSDERRLHIALTRLGRRGLHIGTVYDIGAHRGDWTETVAAESAGSSLHPLRGERRARRRAQAVRPTPLHRDPDLGGQARRLLRHGRFRRLLLP